MDISVIHLSNNLGQIPVNKKDMGGMGPNG